MEQSVSVVTHTKSKNFFFFTFVCVLNRNKNRTRVEVIILHSSSDSQQRNLAFRKAPAKTRKIILATNIAESSITVPDVKYGRAS